MNITKKLYAERKINLRNKKSYFVGVPKKWIDKGLVTINKNVRMVYDQQENSITIKF